MPPADAAVADRGSRGDGQVRRGRYEGEVYRSLSAVAKAVTGKHWNGYHFFKLRQNGDADE